MGGNDIIITKRGSVFYIMKEFETMEEIRESVPSPKYIVGPHGQLFEEDGILHNQEQEKIKEAEQPLGDIGKMLQMKLEEENPEVAIQQKFEGRFYLEAKKKEEKIYEEIRKLNQQLMEKNPPPEECLERIQHFFMIRRQAEEIVLANYI